MWSLAASLSLTLDSTTPLSSSRRGLSFSRLAAGSTYMALGTGIWGLTAPRPWLVAGGWRRLPGPGPARAPPRAPRGRREAEGARARARVCAYMFVWWGCPSPAARCAASSSESYNEDSHRTQDGWCFVVSRVCVSHLSTSGILCLQLLRHLPLALVDGVGPLERVRFALGALCAAEARCAGEAGCTLPVRRPRSLSPPYFSHPA